MVFDVNLPYSNITAEAVTLALTLDSGTCRTLAHICKKLHEVLGFGYYHSGCKQRWIEYASVRETQRKAVYREDDIAELLKKFSDMPRRKAVSFIARALNMNWDTVDCITIRLAGEGRRKASLHRDKGIAMMRQDGLTARVIGERFGLSEGRVRNILTRMKGQTVAHTEASKATAS